MSKSLPERLVVGEFGMELLDEKGFCVADIPRTQILQGYERLGIAHWADKPGVSHVEAGEDVAKAIARRMVACWNAAAGVETEVLEQAGPAALTAACRLKLAEDKAASCAANLGVLTAQRNDLLAAMNHVRECSVRAETADGERVNTNPVCKLEILANDGSTLYRISFGMNGGLEVSAVMLSSHNGSVLDTELLISPESRNCIRIERKPFGG